MSTFREEFVWLELGIALILNLLMEDFLCYPNAVWAKFCLIKFSPSCASLPDFASCPLRNGISTVDYGSVESLVACPKEDGDLAVGDPGLFITAAAIGTGVTESFLFFKLACRLSLFKYASLRLVIVRCKMSPIRDTFLISSFNSLLIKWPNLRANLFKNSSFRRRFYSACSFSLITYSTSSKPVILYLPLAGEAPPSGVLASDLLIDFLCSFGHLILY